MRVTAPWPSPSDLDLSLNFNSSFTFDDATVLAALDQLFPDEVLPETRSGAVERRSVATDTNDLPPCCELSAAMSCQGRGSVNVSSDPVDLSKSKPSAPTVVVIESSAVSPTVHLNPPSPVMTPPITPVDVDGGVAKTTKSAESHPVLVPLSLPFPDVGRDVMLQSGEEGYEQSGKDLLDCASTTPGRRVTFMSSPSASPPRRIFAMPNAGFNTPRLPSAIERVRLSDAISKTPEPMVSRRFSLRSSDSGNGSGEEGRRLRPRPTPPTRFIGEPFRSNRTLGHQASNGSGETEKRSNSTSPLMKYTRISKSEKISKKAKSAQIEIVCAPRKDNDANSAITPKRKSTGSTKESAPKKKRSELQYKASRNDRGKDRKQMEKIHSCDTCRKPCATLKGLKTHIESMHLGIRYRCTICGLIGTMKPSVSLHIQKKHLMLDQEFNAGNMVERFTT